MKIRDKKLRANVEVADRLCPQRDCYWPRPDPGRFTQGKGYSNAVAGRWLCGTRRSRVTTSELLDPKERTYGKQ